MCQPVIALFGLNRDTFLGMCRLEIALFEIFNLTIFFYSDRMPQVNYRGSNMETYEFLCIFCREIGISEYQFMRKCGFKGTGLRSLISKDYGTITYKTYLAIADMCKQYNLNVSVLKNFIKV